MITATGTVPFPAAADGAPIRACGASLRRVAGGFDDAATDLVGIGQSTRAAWQGRAADAFVDHLDHRAERIREMADIVQSIVGVLDDLADTVDGCCRNYSQAAALENRLTPYLPASQVAVAAAVAAQAGVVVALQTAGAAYGGRLRLIELRVRSERFLGELAETIGQVIDSVRDDVAAVFEAAEAGDVPNTLVAIANITVEIPRADGTTLRLAVGEVIEVINPVLRDVAAFEDGVTVHLEPVIVPGWAAATEKAFRTGEGIVDYTRITERVEYLENQRRSPSDLSLSMYLTTGTDAGGVRHLNFYAGGIVNPEDGGLYGDTGTRHALAAAGSVITRDGPEEQAVLGTLLARSQPGDTVNLFLHSQSGIVGQNVIDRLEAQGRRVNIVAFGPPDLQMRSTTGEVHLQQNRFDLVPALRGAAPGVGTVVGDNVNIVELSGRYGSVVGENHDPTYYARLIAEHPDDPGVQDLTRFIAGLPPEDAGSGTLITLAGPAAPSGPSIDARDLAPAAGP